ncbi:NAD(P)/FAD-dependent oxidoreductase [Humitalea sp. 24SJ18S-53]|uniref:NAD(P)/FAD-dependent oxidoreductase n=1 Tax=Humitalea sp. 24SJ18S-53 TaxID=3422307 RepID=UPI003D67883B
MGSRCIVLGGGLVGMAVALGASDAGAEVIVLDDGDMAFRASRGNAGLIWVQGKGDHMAAYARWTRQSAALWPQFAASLLQRTGIDVEYRQPGGFHLCLGERELEVRAEICANLARQPGGTPMRMVDHATLREHIPLIGPAVRGASWSPEDGYANPLALLHAMHVAAKLAGIVYRPAEPAGDILPLPGGGFRVQTEAAQWAADRVILAAGLANATLGPMVGLDVPVRPVRGQIVVTERVPRFLDYPTSTIRQNENGSVMFGNSVERDAGFSTATSIDITGRHAARAMLEFPHLAQARVVRSWSALRVMPRDEFPIYQQSARHPGAFVATCHSGVTLAAVHARVLGPALGEGSLPPDGAAFTTERFHAAPDHAA